MGTHRWTLCQKVTCPDGVAVGRLGPFFKTFIPYPGLGLVNYGIFRNKDQDRDAETVDEVTNVNCPGQPYPDEFLVEFQEDIINEPIGSIGWRSLYGTGWEWTFYPKGHENP